MVVQAFQPHHFNFKCLDQLVIECFSNYYAFNFDMRFIHGKSINVSVMIILQLFHLAISLMWEISKC